MIARFDLPVFWSADGKEFYQLRVGSSGSEGGDKDLKRLDRTFWEPRVDALYKASVEYKKDDKGADMAVQCSERKTKLKELPAADAKTARRRRQVLQAALEPLRLLARARQHRQVLLRRQRARARARQELPPVGRHEGRHEAAEDDQRRHATPRATSSRRSRARCASSSTSTRPPGCRTRRRRSSSTSSRPTTTS